MNEQLSQTRSAYFYELPNARRVVRMAIKITTVHETYCEHSLFLVHVDIASVATEVFVHDVIGLDDDADVP
jgi:hypothetical protein